MSEADYMDDVQHLDRWDYENKVAQTHSVISFKGRVVFEGSRAACWVFKRKFGGFARAIANKGSSHD